MSIKEFSQKNSVALFYATIVLIIAVIVLGFMSFGRRGLGGMSPRNFQGNNQQGMMQDGANFPGQNTQDQAQGQPQDQAQQIQ